jgi:hypothetical protein
MKLNLLKKLILRDPCARDDARLSESVKILELQASVYVRFPKVKQHPKCMDHAISCLENHLVIVL